MLPFQGRVAQRESTPFTREGSQVQSLSRPPCFAPSGLRMAGHSQKTGEACPPKLERSESEGGLLPLAAHSRGRGPVAPTMLRPFGASHGRPLIKTGRDMSAPSLSDLLPTFARGPRATQLRANGIIAAGDR